MAAEGIPLPRAIKLDGFPLDRLDPGGDVIEVLSKVLVTEYSEEALPGDGAKFDVGLTVAEELQIGLVGLDGFSLVFAGSTATLVRLGVELGPAGTKLKLGAGARLRFPRSVLKPVVQEGDEWVDDPSRQFGEIEINAGIIVDDNWDVTFDGANAFNLEPVMIADSGFVIEGQVALDLSETTQLPESAALGLPASWKGVVFKNLTVHLPPAITDAVPIANVGFQNFHIGSGGVSGRIGLAAGGAAVTGRIGGFAFTPTAFAVDLRQNCLVGAELAGHLELPFFDAPVDVKVGFDLAGNFTVALSSATGLVKLDKPGVLSFELNGLAISKRDGVWVIALSGAIQPDVGGLEWPKISVQSLEIDSEGNVRVEGGWLDLREQYVLSFYGFQLSISRIGFGTTVDGKRWIGFTGGLKLVEGLSAGASVEGMRITWDPAGGGVTFSLEGVGVEFEVPGVISFKGFVSMREPEPGVFRFDGDITISLQTIGLEIEGQLVIGYNQPADYTFFAIYLGVELPAGIPLWTTGLGLYGLAGLFALNMEPGRNPDEPWYAIQPAPSWYHRNPPGVGVTQLRKWKDAEGGFGFGAGVTIGTVADNGFTFAGRMLFAIVFPGPIIFLEGRANVLKERSSLRDEPVFRTLVTLDGREREVLVGIDAQYKIEDGAELIDIHGGVEAFFDFDDPMAWHLYLGLEEPRDRRIGADIFLRIFHSDAYFMIDARRVKAGAWTGIDKHYTFGPLEVGLSAWMEGKAELSFKPVYLKGSLTLHGGITAKAFGFGFSLAAEARVEAGVFDPFHVKAELSVSVDLPWPFDDISVDITLEWGPDPTPPLLPAPLKEVAIAHNKITTTWPLPAAGSLLVPKVDMNTANALPGFFEDQAPTLSAAATAAAPPGNAPVVPLDSRPDLTFGLAVHDDPNIGVNQHAAYPAANPMGWVWIGDPAKNQGPVRARPSLQEVLLERWTGSAWAVVARKGVGANASGVPTIYGSWAPVSDGASSGGAANLANTKLRVWSKNPFDFARRTGGEWTAWLRRVHPLYPCIDIPGDREVCCDFTDVEVGTTPARPWRCEDNDAFSVTWLEPPAPVVTDGDGGRKGRALCFGRGTTFEVHLDRSATEIRIEVDAEPVERELDCVDFRDRRASRARNPRIEGKVEFTTYYGGSPAAHSTIRTVQLAGSSMGGLEVGEETIVVFPEPVDVVEVLASTAVTSLVVESLDDHHRVLDHQEIVVRDSAELLRFTARSGRQIAAIRVKSLEPNTAALHVVCTGASNEAVVTATGYADNGVVVDQQTAKDGSVQLGGRHVRTVVVGSDDAGFCLRSVCVTVGLSAADKLALGAKQQHVIDELARWSADGEVLAPWSQYRLRVATKLEVQLASGSGLNAGFAGTRTITQAAYFRTQGPPGMAAFSTPANHPVAAEPAGAMATPPFETGLEDLTRYVQQTIPPTVPERAGDAPRMPRPVYRGYDVGVRFNETYVDQMYAMAARDLQLYLYDNNDEPVRDERGRLLTPANRWGRVDTLTGTATETDEQWLAVLAGATCMTTSFDIDRVTRNLSLARGGFVLDPETVYEGRLTPLLLHEPFAGYAVGATASGPAGTLSSAGGLNTWQVSDSGSTDGPSTWVVREDGTPPARSIEQTSNISAGPGSRDAAFPGGTFLVLQPRAMLAAESPDQPGQWTDYRLSLYVRSTDDDIVGAAVRVSGASAYIVMLDRQRGRRRLVLRQEGGSVVLAEAPGSYSPGVDSHLSIEAVGKRLRVHVDGEAVFDVSDATLATGSVALYCADNAGARFTDVRVDDLRRTNPTVYRFRFTTSLFTDVRHHLGSGTDGRFAARVASAAPVTGAAAGAVAPSGAVAAPTEAEARLYDALAAAALATAATTPVPTPEVTVVAVAGGGPRRALVVRTGEPLDWTRTSLQVSHAPASGRPVDVVPARRAKLLGASFAASSASIGDESATVLLLEPGNVAGLRIDRRVLASPTAPAMADGTVLAEPDMIAGALEGPRVVVPAWQPALADLSELDLVQPAGVGSPAWSAGGGTLTKNGPFHGLEWPWNATSRKEPGVLAVSRPASVAVPADMRLSVDVAVSAPGSAGLVFRYRDPSNHYRFAVDTRSGRHVLARFSGGAVTVLAQSRIPAGAGPTRQVVVDAVGDLLTVSVDGAPVASVTDGTHRGGAVGFYAYGSPPASFSAVAVERLDRRVGPWRIDDVGVQGQASSWSVAFGMLRKAAAAPPSVGSSYAVLAAGSWSDVSVETAMVLPASGPVGVTFRYASPADNLAVVFDRSAGTVSLVRTEAGAATTLWSGALAASVEAVALRVEAVGTRIRLWLDGSLSFELLVPGSTSGPATAGSAGVWSAMPVALDVLPFVVRHAVPSWEPWYTFGTEGHRVAGRRLRVVAGTSPAGAPAVAGEEVRWRGATAVAFPAEGVDLRLVDPAAGDVVLHARRFLPPSRFTSLDVRLVRAADSTALCLLPPGGTAPLPAGTVRLSFSYRRDNRSVDASSLVLSEEGDTTPETGIIDVNLD